MAAPQCVTTCLLLINIIKFPLVFTFLTWNFCSGGFLIAFMKDAGFPLKPFDFSVPGDFLNSALYWLYLFKVFDCNCNVVTSSENDRTFEQATYVNFFAEVSCFVRGVWIVASLNGLHFIKQENMSFYGWFNANESKLPLCIVLLLPTMSVLCFFVWATWFPPRFLPF